MTSDAKKLYQNRLDSNPVITSITSQQGKIYAII